MAESGDAKRLLRESRGKAGWNPTGQVIARTCRLYSEME